MKKYLLIFACLILSLPMMAQTWGYVKDEGGYTNIRSGPGTNYGIVEKRRDGTAIMYSAGTGSWLRAYTDDGRFVGYIHTSKVVKKEPRNPRYSDSYYTDIRQGTVVREGGYTNIRRGPGVNYPIVDKVRDGSTIWYSGRGSWLKVYYGDGSFRGYMSANKIIR